MSFLHERKYLKSGQVIEVKLNMQANVCIMSDANFQNYRSGKAYTYFGGLATISPCHITVPSSGDWNLVIDLGGGSGRLEYSVLYLD